MKKLKKAKGINENVVKNIADQEYVDVLFNKYFISHTMKRIQTKLHGVGTYDVCKIFLSCFDDKKYILNDAINSLVYFHNDIKKSIKSIEPSKVNKIKSIKSIKPLQLWSRFFLFSSLYIY